MEDDEHGTGDEEEEQQPDERAEGGQAKGKGSSVLGKVRPAVQPCRVVQMGPGCSRGANAWQLDHPALSLELVGGRAEAQEEGLASGAAAAGGAAQEVEAGAF